MPREALVALLYFLAKLPRLSVIASSPAFKWNANYFFSPAIPAPFKPRYLTAFWSWPMDTLPHVSSPIFIQTSYPSPSSSTTIPDLPRLSSFSSTYRFAHGSLLFIDRSAPAIVIFLPPSLSPSRSLRLLVRLVYRPTLLSTTSTAFSPKPVFGCRVKRLAKVQVSFIAYTRSRASIHRSHPCRFFFPLHPFFLFIIQEITLENLLSNEIFFSRRQKTWTCLVSIFRLEISSLETSFESETGFFNPEALVNDG